MRRSFQTAGGWLLALALIGCAPKRPPGAEIHDGPLPWMTEEGQLNANLDLARTFLDQGQLTKAQGIIQYLRSIDNKQPELDLLQGRLLHAEGMLDQAEPLLLKAEGRMTDPRDAQHALGLLYADMGRVDDAISTYRGIVKKTETDAKAWNNLGFLLYAQRSCGDAVDAFEHAIQNDGANARYKNNLGFALACSGQETEAYNAFRSAGGDAAAWYNLGHASELRGDWTAAHKNFNKALEIDPGYRPAREGLKRLENPQEEP